MIGRKGEADARLDLLILLVTIPLSLFFYILSIEEPNVIIGTRFVGIGNTSFVYTVSISVTYKPITVYNITVLAGSTPLNCTITPKPPANVTSTGSLLVTLQCPAAGSSVIVRTSSGSYNASLPMSVGVNCNNCEGYYIW